MEDLSMQYFIHDLKENDPFREERKDTARNNETSRYCGRQTQDGEQIHARYYGY